MTRTGSLGTPTGQQKVGEERLHGHAWPPVGQAAVSPEQDSSAFSLECSLLNCAFCRLGTVLSHVLGRAEGHSALSPELYHDRCVLFPHSTLTRGRAVATRSQVRDRL